MDAGKVYTASNGQLKLHDKGLEIEISGKVTQLRFKDVKRVRLQAAEAESDGYFDIVAKDGNGYRLRFGVDGNEVWAGVEGEIEGAENTNRPNGIKRTLLPLICLVCYIGVVIALVSAGIINLPGAPRNMDIRTHNIGIEALGVVDDFLRGAITAQRARDKIDLLYDRINEFTPDDFWEQGSHLSVSGSILGIQIDMGSIAFREVWRFEGSENIDRDVQGSRDRLADMLNILSTNDWLVLVSSAIISFIIIAGLVLLLAVKAKAGRKLLKIIMPIGVVLVVAFSTAWMLTDGFDTFRERARVSQIQDIAEEYIVYFVENAGFVAPTTARILRAGYSSAASGDIFARVFEADGIFYITAQARTRGGGISTSDWVIIHGGAMDREIYTNDDTGNDYDSVEHALDVLRLNTAITEHWLSLGIDSSP